MYLHESRYKTTYRTKTTNLIRRLEGKTLLRNIVLSYATSCREKETIIDPLPIGDNEYNFAVDPTTSFHICKHKELFVSGIKKAKGIFIKGVGGKVKVRGYGLIAINVVDDDEKECDLVISNVLYIPQSPTNLTSPQLWSECTKHLYGTGEITVGGTTILFWKDNSHSKLIQHHLELKISIFVANNAQAKIIKRLHSRCNN